MAILKHVDFEVPDFGELAGTPVAGLGYREAVMALGPVAYWRLDETSGPTLADISGNHHDAIAIGAVQYGRASLVFNDANTCVDFAGGRAEIGTPTALTNLVTFSVIAVIQPDTLPSSGQYPQIVCQFSATTGKRININLQGSFSAKIQSGIDTDGTRASSVATADYIPSTTEPTLLVTTYDDAGDRKVRIYVNGKEVEYDDQTAATGTIVDGSSIGWCIGDRMGGGRAYDGRIDEVAVFSDVLSPQQVLDLYRIGVGKLHAS